MTALTVIEPGWGTTVQDLGRVGYAHLGVPPSGMVDQRLGSLVNRLVGNPDGAALIETCGGLVLRAEQPVLLASSVDAAPVALAAGATYRIPEGQRLWEYVAVRGGLAVEPVLASAATDTLSGLGPSPVVAGLALVVGPDPGTPITTDAAPVGLLADTARLLPGPRADWVTVDWSVPLTVSDTSRVGVRLAGARLTRLRLDELPSEGLVRGAVQAPPGGELVMMLADHPTTGGYPVVAVVHPDDVATVAQHRPGAAVRFRALG